MKKFKTIVISILMVFSLIFSSSVQIMAAGKTAIGLENNTPNGTSDAKAFVDGIKDKVSSYSVTYKSPSSVKESDFYSKSKCIKYWSSHGSNTGRVWGTDSNVDLNIFDKSFSWAGGNLEFAFLAACRQLDGSNKNPRKRYAKAMIGGKAVRVICGYHEQAPSKIDKKVADKFIAYAKTGESVKSSWILANKYWEDKGYSTGVYCVLTHSGNVQYSRFPGFPGKIYTRPGASSKTILRFSKANPNGTTQKYSTSNDLEKTKTIEASNVPDYVLRPSAIKLNVDNDTDMAVIRENTSVSLIGDEIGNTELENSSNQAVDLCKQELNQSISNYSNIDLTQAKISVEPIVMAKVDLDGNSDSEKETTVAYDVTIKNTYNGIEIQGDYLSGIVNDQSALYLSGNWNDMEKVKADSKKKVIDYTTAKNSVHAFSKSSLVKGDLKFVFNADTGYYEPSWVFVSDEDELTYSVNCFDGGISVE